MSCLIVGATGLCGNFIVKHATEFFSNGFTISRSEPAFVKDNKKVTAILDKNSSSWAEKVAEVKKSNPDCTTFFSGIGTTRAKVGGVENQRKIDLDLNYDLAKAAKEAGFTTYVLISSVGASSSSHFAYPKMKGELEDKVIALDFDQCIIVRPGLLLGERSEHKGLTNAIFVKAGSWIYGSRFSKYLLSPVYGEEVALACLKASRKAHDEKVVIITGQEVNDLAASSD